MVRPKWNSLIKAITAAQLMVEVSYWHQADMLYVLVNADFWGQSGQGLPAAYQRHAANEIKQVGIGKRLAGGPSGSLARSMRSATHNVSASAPTLTINTASS